LALEVLMRRYTGLFSYPVPIDEDYVASKVGLPVPMFRQLLYKMSLEHVIKYIPSDHATVLFLHHERLRPKNVHLDPERYDLLKNASLGRMQKMIDFVSEEDVCRSAYLLKYFGQEESADCGNCDVCRSAKSKTAGHEDTAAQLKYFINEEKEGRYSIDDVTLKFASAADSVSDDLMLVLRRLIYEGIVPPPQV
jgi:ATP-dependent DNA helicase RecQ